MIPWKSADIKIKLGLLVQNNVKHNVAFDPWEWFTHGVNGITWELVRRIQSEAQSHSYLTSRPPYSWVRESKLGSGGALLLGLWAGCACMDFRVFSLPTPAPESLSQPCSQNLFCYCCFTHRNRKCLKIYMFFKGKSSTSQVLGGSTNNPEP